MQIITFPIVCIDASGTEREGRRGLVLCLSLFPLVFEERSCLVSKWISRVFISCPPFFFHPFLSSRKYQTDSHPLRGYLYSTLPLSPICFVGHHCQKLNEGVHKHLSWELMMVCGSGIMDDTSIPPISVTKTRCSLGNEICILSPSPLPSLTLTLHSYADWLNLPHSLSSLFLSLLLQRSFLRVRGYISSLGLGECRVGVWDHCECSTGTIEA